MFEFLSPGAFGLGESHCLAIHGHAVAVKLDGDGVGADAGVGIVPDLLHRHGHLALADGVGQGIAVGGRAVGGGVAGHAVGDAVDIAGPRSLHLLVLGQIGKAELPVGAGDGLGLTGLYRVFQQNHGDLVGPQAGGIVAIHPLLHAGDVDGAGYEGVGYIEAVNSHRILVAVHSDGTAVINQFVQVNLLVAVGVAAPLGHGVGVGLAVGIPQRQTGKAVGVVAGQLHALHDGAIPQQDQGGGGVKPSHGIPALANGDAVGTLIHVGHGNLTLAGIGGGDAGRGIVYGIAAVGLGLHGVVNALGAGLHVIGGQGGLAGSAAGGDGHGAGQHVVTLAGYGVLLAYLLPQLHGNFHIGVVGQPHLLHGDLHILRIHLVGDGDGALVLILGYDGLGAVGHDVAAGGSGLHGIVGVAAAVAHVGGGQFQGRGGLTGADGHAAGLHVVALTGHGVLVAHHAPQIHGHIHRRHSGGLPHLVDGNGHGVGALGGVVQVNDLIPVDVGALERIAVGMMEVIEYAVLGDGGQLLVGHIPVAAFQDLGADIGLANLVTVQVVVVDGDVILGGHDTALVVENHHIGVVYLLQGEGKSALGLDAVDGAVQEVVAVSVIILVIVGVDNDLFAFRADYHFAGLGLGGLSHAVDVGGVIADHLIAEDIGADVVVGNDEGTVVPGGVVHVEVVVINGDHILLAAEGGAHFLSGVHDLLDGGHGAVAVGGVGVAGQVLKGIGPAALGGDVHGVLVGLNAAVVGLAVGIELDLHGGRLIAAGQHLPHLDHGQGGVLHLLHGVGEHIAHLAGGVAGYLVLGDGILVGVAVGVVLLQILKGALPGAVGLGVGLSQGEGLGEAGVPLPGQGKGNFFHRGTLPYLGYRDGDQLLLQGVGNGTGAVADHIGLAVNDDGAAMLHPHAAVHLIHGVVLGAAVGAIGLQAVEHIAAGGGGGLNGSLVQNGTVFIHFEHAHGNGAVGLLAAVHPNFLTFHLGGAGAEGVGKVEHAGLRVYAHLRGVAIGQRSVHRLLDGVLDLGAGHLLAVLLHILILFQTAEGDVGGIISLVAAADNLAGIHAVGVQGEGQLGTAGLVALHPNLVGGDGGLSLIDNVVNSELIGRVLYHSCGIAFGYVALAEGVLNELALVVPQG